MPWGAQVTFTAGELGEPTQIDATGPAYDAARAAFKEAWDGVEPVDMGVGGSIPFIAAFRDAFPDASVLVTGVEDPDTRAHGANEGLHLAEFERVCLAEALLLHNLASGTRRAAVRAEADRHQWRAREVSAGRRGRRTVAGLAGGRAKRGRMVGPAPSPGGRDSARDRRAVRRQHRDCTCRGARSARRHLHVP